MTSLLVMPGLTQASVGMKSRASARLFYSYIGDHYATFSRFDDWQISELIYAIKSFVDWTNTNSPSLELEISMPIKLPPWWMATEIPLIENDWKNIRLYCRNSSTVAPWEWKDAIYLIRLSPPFAIRYSSSLSSPLIYVGSGAIRQRWADHRKWLVHLGYYLPGARYEVWVSRHAEYQRIEADALFNFREHAKRLPLMNRRVEEQSRGDADDYDENYHEKLIAPDRRHFWAIEPLDEDVKEYFDKRKFENLYPVLTSSTASVARITSQGGLA